MIKRDIKKFIAMVSMLALIPTVSVCAGTVTREEQKRGVNNYSNSYVGSVGSYAAGGSATLSTTSAQNTTKTSKYYYVATYRYNHYTRKYDLSSTNPVVLASGGAVSTQVNRDKTSEIYDYVHTVSGYATSSSSSQKLDAYTYKALQYYR